MTLSDLADIFFGGRQDRRIPTVQVPRPNRFFSREFRKIKILVRNFNY